jgi:uroporphyrinogen decarboxylase
VPYGYYLPETYAVARTADWKKLAPLDPYRGTLGEMVEVVRGVRSRVGDEVFRLATVFCPLMVARQLAGERRLLLDLREHPAALHEAMEVIAGTVADFAVALLENGADGIFFATQSNTPDFMAVEEYAAFGHPYNLRVLRRIEGRSGFTLLHVCKLHPRFDEFVDYPVHAINWDDRATPPSLAEARKKTDKCLVGGIDKDGVLRTGTPQQVTAQVQDAIRAAGRRKLIVAPGCGIPVDCPDANLRAMGRAVRG